MVRLLEYFIYLFIKFSCTIKFCRGGLFNQAENVVNIPSGGAEVSEAYDTRICRCIK